MSAVLDQILAASSRLARPSNAWVLFLASEQKAASATPWRKLLLRRLSENPQTWGLPGGAVGDDESPEQAAKRWAKTQTGLACDAFSDSIDHASGSIFIAGIDADPAELERAIPAKTFWAPRDFLSSPTLHPAARAALETLDQNPAQADSATTNRSGEFMSTDLASLDREIALLQSRRAAAIKTTSFKPGEMRAVATPDATGRLITRYQGHPDACWDQFNPSIRYVRRILTPGSSR